MAYGKTGKVQMKQLRLLCWGGSGLSSDWNANRKPSNIDQAGEVSAGKKDSTGGWTAGDLCYGLAG